MVSAGKHGKQKRKLVDRLRRNPRRSCSLQSLLKGMSKETKAIKTCQEQPPGEVSSVKGMNDENSPAAENVKSESSGGKRGIVALASPVPRTPPGTPKSPNVLLEEEQVLTPATNDGCSSLPAPPSLKSGTMATKLQLLIHENSRLKQQVAKANSEKEVFEKQLQERSVLQASIQAQIAARSSLMAHNEYLEARYRRLAEKAETGNHKEMKKLEQELEIVSKQLEVAHEKVEQLTLSIKQLEKTNADLTQGLHRSEQVRRELHEQVMSHRGNMRVYCRLRPTLQEEPDDTIAKEKSARFCIQDGGPGGSRKRLRIESSGGVTLDGSKKLKSWEFNFDRVFSEEESQSSVYAEVHGLVQSVLDGFNVCIFAYGQTGSGKTHTMIGSHNENGAGICPRTIETLFSARKENQSISLSVLEIYNENLVDLLPNGNAVESERPKRRRKSTRSNSGGLQIRHDGPTSTTFVDGLNIVPVRSAKHTQELLDKALAARTVAKTNANERSSRSHSVLSFYVTSGDENKKSVMHFVDLAGSERLGHSRSGSDPKLLKEQCAINTSLTALKNTLRALANKQGHVPFRDSKLTYLLQNAWQSSSSKTLMICTVSQESEHLNESLNSIRFAEKVLNDAI